MSLYDIILNPRSLFLNEVRCNTELHLLNILTKY